MKLALHLPSQKKVAIKILSKHFFEESEQIRYAYKEKMMLSQCQESPFTVRFLGSFQTSDFLYLILRIYS